MSYDNFKQGTLGNIDELEQLFGLFVANAKKVWVEQDDAIRAPGDCVFTAKITMHRSGDSLTISVEAAEKMPGRVKAVVTAMMTRDNGLQIFAPVQDDLPGVLRAIPGAKAE